MPPGARSSEVACGYALRHRAQEMDVLRLRLVVDEPDLPVARVING